MKYLIDSSIQMGLALQHTLEQLRMEEFPSDSPRVFGDLLLSLTNHILDRLLDLASEEREPPPVIPQAEAALLARSLAQIAHSARPVAGSNSDFVPWAMVHPVEMLCREISPESRVIIFPRWTYNYGYYEAIAPLKRLMDGIATGTGEDFFKGRPQYYAVLSFPAVEGYHILQNAAWGHEIGHHADTVFSVSERVMREPLIDQGDIDLEIADLLPAGPDREQILRSSGEVLRLQAMEKAAWLTRRWVRELVADIFSIHVFGPASLFAFASIVPVMHSLDQPDLEYPPARLRLQTMLREVRELEYDHIVDEEPTTETQQSVRSALASELARLQALADQEPSEQVKPEY